MNQKNFEYLKNGLKYLGFGEGLNNKLGEELASGKEEFQLHTENGYGWDRVKFTLDFRKSDSSDMFFFNRYTATFKPEGDTPERSQTFYVKKNTGITAKEAYNLLSGRFVNKDLLTKDNKPYNAWLQLDFNEKDASGNHKIKMIHQAYGFNLESELAKHPIKELNDPATKERLMQSLERGNLHQVTFVRGDRVDNMFIEANPQFKTLNLYDSRLKKVYQEFGRREPQMSDTGKEISEPEKKQEKKKEAKEAEAERKGNKAPRKRLGV